jgi:hypothetical protein
LPLRAMAAPASGGGQVFECEFDCGFRGSFQLVEAHESACTCAAAEGARITSKLAPSDADMRDREEVVTMAAAMAGCVLRGGAGGGALPVAPVYTAAAQQPRHSLPSRLQALESDRLPPSAMQRYGSYMARVDCLDMAVFGAKYAGTLLERVAALENRECSNPGAVERDLASFGTQLSLEKQGKGSHSAQV